MNFHLNTSEIFIPDGEPVEQALRRTTHLCFSAHQDDIEIMAATPIIECFQQKDKWFTGVVVSDGRVSPRNGIYENYTDDEMRLVLHSRDTAHRDHLRPIDLVWRKT